MPNNPELSWADNQLSRTIRESEAAHRDRYDRRDLQRPADPGWMSCSCGTWEGYFVDYEHHRAEAVALAVREFLAKPLRKASFYWQGKFVKGRDLVELSTVVEIPDYIVKQALLDDPPL